MAVQIHRGYEGWLDNNLRDLKSLEKKYRGDLQIKTIDKKSYEIEISGKRGRRNGSHRLHLRCDYPTPAQPPKFTLLNKLEMERIQHPHIKAVYICIKQPWVPRTPLRMAIETLAETWWKS